VERLENELEQLMAHLQTSPTPSPAGPTHPAVDDDDYLDSDAIAHPDHSVPTGGVGAEQDLDALLARLGEEEQQIRDDIKRMRDAYARSLRRDYVATKGGGTTATAKPATTSPATLTSPQLSPTSAGEESSDEAHEALKEAERKVTVLRRRAEEVRRSIRSQGSQIGGGFGVHGPSVRRKRDAATVIGERRGDQAQVQAQIGDGDGGEELRELERELERMEEKERARRRREAEGRARVTLEMARLLLRDEAAKRDEEERQREEAERREAERGMAEMRDRIERMRIMAQAVKPRHTPPPPTTTTITSRPTTNAQHTTMMSSSPLTPPSHLPPLSPVPAAALMMAARGPHLQPLTPGASPTAATQQPRQFYYTTAPAAPPMGSRPSVPPLPTPSAGPGLAPRPSFSPRATVGLGGGGRGSSTTEDDSELNSMMADMLTHLKATSPQTDVKDISPPVARAGSGSAGPPPVPPKKLISASPAQASADPRACGRCGKAVDDYGGGVVQAMDRRWHPACFVCHACRYTSPPPPHTHTRHTRHTHSLALLTLACAVRAGQWRADGPARRGCVLPTKRPTPLHGLLPTAVRPVAPSSCSRCSLLFDDDDVLLM
jgi:hypothetical protein